MFGIPADTLALWANVVSLAGLALAGAGSIAAYQLHARMNAEHSRELQRTQLEAQTQVEASREAAAQASAHTAELLRANVDLQRKLTHAAAPPDQFRRDLTKEQMAKFAATIKGKVRAINLFTVPDREATIFGVTVLEALQKADVSVTWFRMQSPHALGPGVANTGVVIYESPGEKGADGVGPTLLKAFTDISVQSNLLNPAQPLQGLPSPSLIIAFKPPQFLTPSNEPLRSGMKAAIPTDLLSRAE